MDFGECVADAMIYLQSDSSTVRTPDSQPLVNRSKVHGAKVDHLKDKFSEF